MKREQVSAEGGKLLKTESCCAGPGVSIEWGNWYIPFSITYQFFVFFNSFSFVFLYFSALQLVCTNGATDTPLRSYLHTVKTPWPGCSSYQHTFKCLALALKASPKNCQRPEKWERIQSTRDAKSSSLWLIHHHLFKEYNRWALLIIGTVLKCLASGITQECQELAKRL